MNKTQSFIEIEGSAIEQLAVEKLDFLNAKIEKERIEWFAGMAKKTKRDWPWSAPRLYTQTEIKEKWISDEGYCFAGSAQWQIETRWERLKQKFETFIRMGKTAQSDKGTGMVYIIFDDYELLFAE